MPASGRDENPQAQTSWARMTKKWWVTDDPQLVLEENMRHRLQSHANKARKKEIVTEWNEACDTWCVHEKPEPCEYFSVFSELKPTAPRTAKWKHEDDLMFPSRARWGSAATTSLKALDLSLGEENERAASAFGTPSRHTSISGYCLRGRAYNMGMRLLYAIREITRGVHFPYRVGTALGLHYVDANFERYFSRRFRQSSRGSGSLMVCLPMRISEISANGRVRERSDLNQVGLLRECLSEMPRYIYIHICTHTHTHTRNTHTHSLTHMYI